MRRALRALVEATAWVGVAIGVALILRRLPHANLSLVFLSAVLVVAVRRGLWPSIYAGFLGFLAFNFLFTPPFHTFKVEAEGDVATLIFFLAVAALGGNLAVRVRREMEKKEAALERISNLFDFSRRMVAAAHAADVLAALVEELSRALHCGAVALLPKDGVLCVRATSSQPEVSPESVDIAAAARAWQTEGEARSEMEVPLVPPTESVERWLFLPLSTAAGRIGVVGLTLTQLDSGQAELAESLCDQAAIAVERTELVERLEQARLVSETEQLRSALLSSVSHDLRTPLASIVGSATSFLEYEASLSERDRRTLLQTVLDESERLDRYIQNLLDMTRLGQGNVELRRDWVDLNDLVSGATERLRTVLSRFEVEAHVAPDAALLYVHGALIEQALVNLVDNAARFAPTGSRIEVQARIEGDAVIIDVSDEGPGIPEPERDRVFQMFYSVRSRDRAAHGTGLGLAICRGLIGAHGGGVQALEGPGGVGTCMRITLPINWSARGCDRSPIQ